MFYQNNIESELLSNTIAISKDSNACNFSNIWKCKYFQEPFLYLTISTYKV